LASLKKMVSWTTAPPVYAQRWPWNQKICCTAY